ncbi:hypothetical protein F383_21175 [Gossypium arboreum]|uniref:Uncharacterized protein n=1 Tax=Gossypium arboreum TaxID=29729 RepID=A0A0B0MN42_GOSAR|nr:hypothetical protein F383_21175 [Gossypium arboreum]
MNSDHSTSSDARIYHKPGPLNGSDFLIPSDMSLVS